MEILIGIEEVLRFFEFSEILVVEGGSSVLDEVCEIVFAALISSVYQFVNNLTEVSCHRRSSFFICGVFPFYVSFRIS